MQHNFLEKEPQSAFLPVEITLSVSGKLLEWPD
jgi:hypothetical protein